MTPSCKWPIQRSPLQYSALFALKQWRVNLIKFQTIDQNVTGIGFRLITTSKNKFSLIHISETTP